jgi:hypothetical protein
MYLFYVGGLLLPVTPSAFTIKVKNKNRTLSLVSGGEISLPETSGLCEISFSALLPMVQYPFCIYEGGFKDGMYFADALRQMKSRANPIWFRVLRYGQRASTDISCVIEELSIREDAENGGDLICDISLKQYESYATRIVDPTSGVISISETSNRTVPESITVKQGETLWTIAKLYLGDGSRYSEIYEDNKEAIENAARKNGLSCSESGRYLYAGTVLTLKGGTV